jgi:hypothetical protein
MFESVVCDVIEQALEMLDYGDEIFFAEIGYEADSVVGSVRITIGPGSLSDPIDLTSDDDDDTPPPYWTAVDELEMNN